MAVVFACLAAAGPAEGSPRSVRLGFEVGGASATLATGQPHHPKSVGGGLVLGFKAGTQLSSRVAIYYLNRMPFYVFGDQMPGLGFAVDCLDFNAIALNIAVRDLEIRVGPSFDFMVPIFGNRAFGGGADLRVEYRLNDGPHRRITIGVDVHPSVLSYSEKHGYFSFTKPVLVAGLSLGVEWR